MKKNSLKYLIDTILFIDICSIAVIGFVLGFVIPKGKEHPAAKYFLGLHRHDWGDMHLYLSIVLLILIILHLWFNWAWIVQSTRRYFGRKWKSALWCISAAWIFVLIVAWITLKL